MIPGEYILADAPIECNVGRVTVAISVTNKGDRPVQVGSHFHFFEVNRQMDFDREKAYGKRLNIAAGTAVRFEPGEEKEVILVEFGGNRKLSGFSNLNEGRVISEESKTIALQRLQNANFKNTPS